MPTQPGVGRNNGVHNTRQIAKPTKPSVWVVSFYSIHKRAQENHSVTILNREWLFLVYIQENGAWSCWEIPNTVGNFRINALLNALF